MRTVAVTYFGSSDKDLTAARRHNEMFIVTDWLTEALTRGPGIHGPGIPIYDFSTETPVNTNDWIEVESATVEPLMDQFNLWTIPVDLRYGVTREESEWDQAYPPEEGVPSQITDIKWRVEITRDY